jgi:hypothetical protein
MEKFAELQALLASTEADAKKFYEEGNNAAGTRVRVALNQLRKDVQDVRFDIQRIKNEA